jgi:formylglycine-generating enzyme required for sulfatase activity
MSRVYFILDASGKHHIEEADLPLAIGGAKQSDIVLPDVSPDSVIAHIAIADGHAYIQAADNSVSLFHNHQRLNESVWLKSGDQVQHDDTIIDWLVKGDQVFISVRQRSLDNMLTPPSGPAPTVSVNKNADTVVKAQAEVPVQQSHRTLRWVVAVMFSVLLMVAGFVLFATPVAVSITPEPATRSLNGFPPAIPVGERLLALPGRYTVQAILEGYEPLNQKVDIGRGGFQELDFKLRELPGRVGIEVDPQVSFNLFVNDVAVKTDNKGIARIDRGKHELRVESDRYLPKTRQLSVAGLGKTQTVSFTLQPAWAEVSINSQPDGAEVKVDDIAVGVTPLTTEIVQGQRNITVSLAKHKTVNLQQRVEAGKALQLDTINLPPADGQLVLQTEPTGATVSVGKQFYGTTPLTLSLSSSTEHVVRVSKPGYQRSNKPVTLAAEESRKLTLKLAPQYGVVFVTSRPADASLFVDGKPAGKATQRLRLTTRPHNLEARKTGYASQQATVTPRAGISQNVDLTLKTADQASTASNNSSDVQSGADSLPATVTTAEGQRLRLVSATEPFRMGASRREAGRRANESQRLVQLTRPFYLANNEVTNAEFRKFKPAHQSGTADGAGLNNDNQPVVNISWDDAARYCNWLSQKDGLPNAYREQSGRMTVVTPMTKGYRLPSEAEWAYVARVLGRPSAARYPWAGNYPPATPAGNFADAQISDTLADTVPGYDDGYRGTAPVGSFPGHPSGFHDLGGNVSEWMNDFYAVYPGEAKKLVKDPAGPNTGQHYVVRDSSWRKGSITELRLSYRDYSRTPRNDLGFRIARNAR